MKYLIISIILITICTSQNSKYDPTFRFAYQSHSIFELGFGYKIIENAYESMKTEGLVFSTEFDTKRMHAFKLSYFKETNMSIAQNGYGLDLQYFIHSKSIALRPSLKFMCIQFSVIMPLIGEKSEDYSIFMVSFQLNL